MSERLRQLNIEVNGIEGDECKLAYDIAIDAVRDSLPANVLQLLEGFSITIGDGLIDSGGVTEAEKKTIVLDYTKNKNSLQETNDLLSDAGVLEKGDWTKVLPKDKDKSWSCLTYQLVHEIGHAVDRLSPGNSYSRIDANLSPTKYGKNNSHEAFAEAFTYWVFGAELEPEVRTIIEQTIGNNRDGL